MRRVALGRGPTGSTDGMHGVVQHERSFSDQSSFTNREIAGWLYLTENTFKGHVQEILRRLDAVMIAIRNSLIHYLHPWL